jgi:hypothetical protein
MPRAGDDTVDTSGLPDARLAAAADKLAGLTSHHSANRARRKAGLASMVPRTRVGVSGHPRSVGGLSGVSI